MSSVSLPSLVLSLMSQHRLTQLDVMRDSGVSNSVLCLWLKDKYKGDNAKVNERMNRWLKHQQQQTSTAAATAAAAGTGVGGTNAHAHHQHHHTMTHLLPSHSHIHSVSTSSSSSSAPPSASSLLASLRIDVRVGLQRFEDYVLWNLRDYSVTPLEFALALCADTGLSLEFAPLIAQQLKQQIKQFRATMRADAAAEVEADAATMTDAAEVMDTDASALAHSFDPLPAGPSRLLRLRVDVSHGGVRLVDEFLWDPRNPHASPEEFARLTVADLALEPHFATVIAHEIRAQCQNASRHPQLAHWEAVDALSVLRTDTDADSAGDGTEPSSAVSAATSARWRPLVSPSYDALSALSSSSPQVAPFASALTALEHERARRKAKQKERDAKHANANTSKPRKRKRGKDRERDRDRDRDEK